MSAEPRFNQKVDTKSGPVVNKRLGRCHVWTGAKFKPSDYGAFQVAGKAKRAHRVSWEAEHGPIPEGMDVLHKCDTQSCVRVSHLFLGTDVDNAADRVAKNRQARGDRHGSRLHPERRPRGRDHYSSKYPERRPRGEAANSKLTNEQVREIRRVYVPYKNSCPKLAKKYGVCSETIARVIRGEHWAHIKQSVVI